MNRIISRGLLTVLVTGGLLALGAGVAHADDTTDGSDGIGSGTQALLDGFLPIHVGGNAISVLGDSSSSGSSASGSSSGSDGSSPSGSTSGLDSLAGGTQALLGADAPVTASGNAISVIGDSSSEGSSFEGASGSGESGTASTSGAEGILGGSQVAGDASAPVRVGGNAISVIGDSSSEGSTFATESGSSGSSGTTSGEEGTLGGTQLIATPNVPVTIGDNAISVIGDSTVAGPGVDDNDVGGDTVTPPGVVSPAAVGAVTLLAATGSDLLVPALAFAVLLMAAGITFMTRTRTSRR